VHGGCLGPAWLPMGWLRLDCRVAVRLDAEALLASVGRELSDLAQEQLVQGGSVTSRPRTAVRALSWLIPIVGGLRCGSVWSMER
jgi:hypothetical protein